MFPVLEHFLDFGNNMGHKNSHFEEKKKQTSMKTHSKIEKKSLHPKV